MTGVNPADLQVRPASAADEPFLRLLGDEIRRPEFAPLLAGGRESVYHDILEQQHESQIAQYQANYPNAQFGIITLAGTPIGKLFLDYRDDEVRLVDFGLLDAYRGHGIGAIVMRGVCVEAGLRGIAVRTMVIQTSPALQFYQRLGFYLVEDCPPHCLVEWRHPDPASLARGWFRAPT